MDQYKAVMHEPTRDSVEFWAACNNDQLLLRRCGDCTRLSYYPRMACPHCGSRKLDWVPARGDGVVYTFTHVFVPFYGENWRSQIPYTPILVDLAEGVRMTSRLIGDDRDQVKIGDAVRLTFVTVDAQKLPFFRRA